MKKNAINIALLLGISPFLIQCVATQQEVNSIELRMRTMDNRMVNMDRELTNLHSKTNDAADVGSIEFLQKRQAELGNTVDRLQSEILQIKGKIEETTYRSRNVQDENAQFKKNLQTQLNETSSRFATLEKQLADSNKLIDELKKARSEDATRQAAAQAKIAAERAAETARAAAEKASLEARLEAEKAARLEAAEKAAKVEPEKKTKLLHEKEPAKTKGTTNPKEKETSHEAAKKKAVAVEHQEASASGSESSAGNANEPGKDIYEKAMGLFKARNYKQAYSIYSEYLAKHPTGDLAANSRFWMGECHYNQNEFELAILEYQKVIADFANSTKAPAAMLKQGFAFEKLQDLETAKIIYKKLLTDYPKSEQADTAKKQLETLKK